MTGRAIDADLAQDELTGSFRAQTPDNQSSNFAVAFPCASKRKDNMKDKHGERPYPDGQADWIADTYFD